jgi:hypothetical protein
METSHQRRADVVRKGVYWLAASAFFLLLFPRSLTSQDKPVQETQSTVSGSTQGDTGLRPVNCQGNTRPLNRDTEYCANRACDVGQYCDRSCRCQPKDEVFCSEGPLGLGDFSSETMICIPNCSRTQYCDGSCKCKPKDPKYCDDTGPYNPLTMICRPTCDPNTQYCNDDCQCVDKETVSCPSDSFDSSAQRCGTDNCPSPKICDPADCRCKESVSCPAEIDPSTQICNGEDRCPAPSTCDRTDCKCKEDVSCPAESFDPSTQRCLGGECPPGQQCDLEICQCEGRETVYCSLGHSSSGADYDSAMMTCDGICPDGFGCDTSICQCKPNIDCATPLESRPEPFNSETGHCEDNCSPAGTCNTELCQCKEKVSCTQDSAGVTDPELQYCDPNACQGPDMICTSDCKCKKERYCLSPESQQRLGWPPYNSETMQCETSACRDPLFYCDASTCECLPRERVPCNRPPESENLNNTTQYCDPNCPGGSSACNMNTCKCKDPLNCSPGGSYDSETRYCVDNCPPDQYCEESSGACRCVPKESTPCSAGVSNFSSYSMTCIDDCASQPGYGSDYYCESSSTKCECQKKGSCKRGETITGVVTEVGQACTDDCDPDYHCVTESTASGARCECKKTEVSIPYVDCPAPGFDSSTQRCGTDRCTDGTCCNRSTCQCESKQPKACNSPGTYDLRCQYCVEEEKCPEDQYCDYSSCTCKERPHAPCSRFSTLSADSEVRQRLRQYYICDNDCPDDQYCYTDENICECRDKEKETVYCPNEGFNSATMTCLDTAGCLQSGSDYICNTSTCTCEKSYCNDGVITAPEVCDPNASPTGCEPDEVCNDYCTGCTKCGNGVTDSDEGCDYNGEESARCPSPGDVCTHDCACQACGSEAVPIASQHSTQCNYCSSGAGTTGLSEHFQICKHPELLRCTGETETTADDSYACACPSAPADCQACNCGGFVGNPPCAPVKIGNCSGAMPVAT